MICLDSSFIIDILRKKPDAVKLFDNIKKDSYFTAIINVYELMAGVYAAKDKNHEKHIKILNEFLANIQVLQLDSISIEYSSKINEELSLKGQIIDDLDILIAGMCLSNNCNKIITKNTKHFSRIKGLEVIGY